MRQKDGLAFSKSYDSNYGTFWTVARFSYKGAKIIHKLYDVVFITIAAVICGAEDWYDIEDFGEANEQL